MKLEGTVFRANLTIADIVIEQPDSPGSFVKQLETCLIKLCRELEIPIPLWLDKNTKEFARFHQTIFFEEQFTEKVNFNRFQIRMLK
jgi:hypothetical protein